MRITWRDWLATIFVVAAAMVYGLWSTGTLMAGISARALGAVVFGLGWAACVTNQAGMAEVFGTGTERRAPIAYVVVASLAGLAALIAGIITLASGNQAMLVTLVAAIIALWAMSTIRHSEAGETTTSEGVNEPMDKAA